MLKLLSHSFASLTRSLISNIFFAGPEDHGMLSSGANLNLNVHNASVHQYDARIRCVLSFLLLRLSLSGLLHTLPDLRILTKRRP